MTRLRTVVLESPYAGDVEANVAYARRAINDCLARGEAPIASHLLLTQPGILDDSKSYERSIGLDSGHAWIQAADTMVVYADRGISSGMLQAIRIAQREGTPIEFRWLDNP